jgi:hypothetical protein
MAGLLLTAASIIIDKLCTPATHWCYATDSTTSTVSLSRLLPALLLLQVLNDSYRTNFYSGYINSACEAIKTYKLNVPMIFAWSL